MTQTMKFDLMRPVAGGGKRYEATMRYPHDSLFKFDVDDFYRWLCKQRPSLEGRKIACEFDDGIILYFHMTDREVMRYA